MRILGPNAPLDVFRLDIVYLIAGLLAEENRPKVQALAPPLTTILTELRNERASLEQAEEILVTHQALLGARDDRTDDRTVELGGIARTRHKDIYQLLFPDLSPSKIGEIAIAKQLKENERVLGILQSLDPSHPLRLDYESDLSTDIAKLKDAVASVNQADTALQLAQVRIRQLKANIDTLRVQTHGELLNIFGNKDDAERFFRKSRSVPSKEQPADSEQNPVQ